MRGAGAIVSASSNPYCCRRQRVSVTGVGEGLSDDESVVVMFFLIRYQTVVASTREINFARQFSSVNLVHRTETNIARQFFEVCPFIIAVQQSFRDALTKRLPTKIALNSPPMARGNPARLYSKWQNAAWSVLERPRHC